MKSNRQDKARVLANGLAKISNDLVAVGLGQILLGRLARHMLKLAAQRHAANKEVSHPEKHASKLAAPTGPEMATCAKCGGAMVFNVPRLGPSGGYVHAQTHKPLCD